MTRSTFAPAPPARCRPTYDENPPRVEYELTALGQSLFGPMDVACAGAREHLHQVDAARAAVAAAG